MKDNPQLAISREINALKDLRDTPRDQPAGDVIIQQKLNEIGAARKSADDEYWNISRLLSRKKLPADKEQYWSDRLRQASWKFRFGDKTTHIEYAAERLAVSPNLEEAMKLLQEMQDMADVLADATTYEGVVQEIVDLPKESFRYIDTVVHGPLSKLLEKGIVIPPDVPQEMAEATQFMFKLLRKIINHPGMRAAFQELEELDATHSSLLGRDELIPLFIIGKSTAKDSENPPISLRELLTLSLASTNARGERQEASSAVIDEYMTAIERAMGKVRGVLETVKEEEKAEIETVKAKTTAYIKKEYQQWDTQGFQLPAEKNTNPPNKDIPKPAGTEKEKEWEPTTWKEIMQTTFFGVKFEKTLRDEELNYREDGKEKPCAPQKVPGDLLSWVSSRRTLQLSELWQWEREADEWRRALPPHEKPSMTAFIRQKVKDYKKAVPIDERNESVTLEDIRTVKRTDQQQALQKKPL